VMARLVVALEGRVYARTLTLLMLGFYKCLRGRGTSPFEATGAPSGIACQGTPFGSLI